jgi:hypothetical protein
VSGCNHMSCSRCGADWCWGCGSMRAACTCLPTGPPRLGLPTGPPRLGRSFWVRARRALQGWLGLRWLARRLRTAGHWRPPSQLETRRQGNAEAFIGFDGAEALELGLRFHAGGLHVPSQPMGPRPLGPRPTGPSGVAGAALAGAAAADGGPLAATESIGDKTPGERRGLPRAGRLFLAEDFGIRTLTLGPASPLETSLQGRAEASIADDGDPWEEKRIAQAEWALALRARSARR